MILNLQLGKSLKMSLTKFFKQKLCVIVITGNFSFECFLSFLFSVFLSFLLLQYRDRWFQNLKFPLGGACIYMDVFGSGMQLIVRLKTDV